MNEFKSRDELSQANLKELETIISAEHRQIAKFSDKRIQKFEEKIPRFAEGCTVQISNVKGLTEPICIFIRLQRSLRMKNQMSADVASRFIITIIGDEEYENELHEVGRCFGTLLSDDVFRGVAYHASTKDEFLAGVEEVFDKAWLLPPNEWDPSIMLDPPNVKFDRLKDFGERRLGRSRGVALGDGGFKDEEQGDTITYTGRFCGGLMDDVKRKIRHYGSE